jgi:hypothetical protein
MTVDTKLLEVADLIDRFLDGRVAHPYEWDDFLSVRDRTPEVERLRREIIDVGNAHPAGSRNEWCDPEGMRGLREIAERLRRL